MAQQPFSPIAIIFLFSWVTFWKGFGLWHAAKHNQKNWFISMLVLNLYTLGLLEIIYLFYFAKQRFTLASFWQKKKK